MQAQVASLDDVASKQAQLLQRPPVPRDTSRRKQWPDALLYVDGQRQRPIRLKNQECGRVGEQKSKLAAPAMTSTRGRPRSERNPSTHPKMQAPYQYLAYSEVNRTEAYTTFAGRTSSDANSTRAV